MKIIIQYFTIIILCFAFIGQVQAQKSTYDRMMETRTLRCGYAPWPGLIEVDPNTGNLSGTSYDYMNAVGEAMLIEIEWTMELGFGEIIEALKTNKVDAICSGAWTNAQRGQHALAVQPISYQGVNIYARPDDRRFDNNLMAINAEDIRIVTSDGESSQAIARADFPKAKTVDLPQLSSSVELLMNVSTGKADIALVDPHVALEFLEMNPGKVRQVPVEYPVRLFGNSTWIRSGEHDLLNALNLATWQLLNTGKIEQILSKHEKYPNTFYRVNKSFSSN